MELRGIGYPAIICRDMDESIGFYTRLGMRHLYTEPNRDDAESVQALLHAGGESFLLLVGPINRELKLAEASLGVGSMQYLTLHVAANFLDRAFFELSKAGLQGSEEIRRGYERLVFLEDPNGVLVTLIAWTTEPPPGVSRATVLEKAGELRAAAGAAFIEDEHVRAAIASLRG